MRLLIVADHASAAQVIRGGLRYIPNCCVLGYMTYRHSCGGQLARVKPDLVIFDESKEAGAVIARIREARSATPQAKLLMLTSRMDARGLAEASNAGIHAAISKSAPTQSISTLVREIAAGNVFHAFVEPAADTSRRPGSDLTARELEILTLMASGASNSQIAAELWVTEQTVKFHLSNVYRKLGVANRTQASHYAHVHHLLDRATISTPAVATAA
jgi:DNA-binding NarL/FixJ family response regulator